MCYGKRFSTENSKGSIPLHIPKSNLNLFLWRQRFDSKRAGIVYLSVNVYPYKDLVLLKMSILTSATTQIYGYTLRKVCAYACDYNKCSSD